MESLAKVAKYLCNRLRKLDKIYGSGTQNLFLKKLKFKVPNYVPTSKRPQVTKFIFWYVQITLQKLVLNKNLLVSKKRKPHRAWTNFYPFIFYGHIIFCYGAWRTLPMILIIFLPDRFSRVRVLVIVCIHRSFYEQNQHLNQQNLTTEITKWWYDTNKANSLNIK